MITSNDNLTIPTQAKLDEIVFPTIAIDLTRSYEESKVVEAYSTILNHYYKTLT